jgi:hypothetical protein
MIHLNRVPLNSPDATGQARGDNQIYMRGVQVKLNIRQVIDNSLVGHAAGVALVYDRERNEQSDVAFTQGLIFAPDGLDLVSPGSVTAPSSADRFKILRRWDFVSHSGASNGTTIQHQIDAFVDLKNKPATWKHNSALGAPADMRKGTLILVPYTNADDAGAVSTDHVTGTVRLYYHDSPV